MAFIVKKFDKFVYWSCSYCGDANWLEQPANITKCPVCGKRFENPNAEPCHLDYDDIRRHKNEDCI